MYKEIVEKLEDRVIYKIRETIMKDSPTSYHAIGGVMNITEIDDNKIEVTYLYEQSRLVIKCPNCGTVIK